jgi:hypothetical protein
MGILVFPNSGGSDSTANDRITALENESIKRSYYKVVTGTSGTITTASGVALVAGQFGSSGNAILSQVDGSGYPLDYSPTDVSGNPVTATLNVSTGAWAASATYTQSSVALFFVVSGTVKNISLFETANPSYISIDDLGKEYVAGTGITIVNNVISATNSGTVTSVSGTANRITSTGGATPVIDISSTFESLLGKVANPLSQFASTTSSQLAGVISDETGSGSLVFATSPALTTPNIGAATATSITIGALGYTDTGILASLADTTNSYDQIILRNKSNGAAASADFIVSNDSGTASTFYGDFGINSSGFTGSGSLNLANATYLTSTSGDLVLGSTTANSIRFVINSGATDALLIDVSSNFTFGGSLYPSATNTYDLGKNATTGDWRQLYTRTVQPAAVTTTNTGGTSLAINSGIGDGSGTASSITFGTPTAGAGGSGAQSLTTRLTIGNSVTFNSSILSSGSNTLSIGTTANSFQSISVNTVQSGTGQGVAITGIANIVGTTTNNTTSGATTNSGAISFTSGNHTGNNGTNSSGNVSLVTGNVTGVGTGVKTGGSINITTGNVSSAVAGSTSGDISLTIGTSGTSTTGAIKLNGKVQGQATILSTTTGINAKSVATTVCYTNNTGTNVVIIGFIIRCTAASAITVGPTINVYTSTPNDIFTSTAITNLTTTSKIFNMPISGMSVLVANSGTVTFSVDTASTGTSQTIAVDLIGYSI